MSVKIVTEKIGWVEKLKEKIQNVEKFKIFKCQNDYLTEEKKQCQNSNRNNWMGREIDRKNSEYRKIECQNMY